MLAQPTAHFAKLWEGGGSWRLAACDACEGR